ncbi:bifunctional hydroxymethylpyrimidine kinase/phosphomethylpyrimidine kinase [Bacillus lacus]|uniref:Hydroxymethylpyrimidine/phosphomethylpyrimidine kinase n=1 Tax=Metabacillus lacus TaxID=1983721 RepID=A0A7X2LYB7_9BACI|nr:bifunctional hydroxymethylpyrimidine kinase/phosphomethylpyrimidine kinase [Metabacillus lacus]MRX70747.1 bifunctional hydroxymethylpyrimidine kinase/phosphomethylpyrimidine kinase [Metabacillus lacus]
MIYKALTIAGSDSGGGAGIQADIKTFQELDVFGMSALTAVTAQNTKGVQNVFPMTVQAVKEQISSIGDDMGTDALKTGMLFNADIIKTVAEAVHNYGWEKLIIDPVMIAKGGAPLLQNEAVSAMIQYLLPLSYVITPNIPEAEALTGISISSEEDKRKAAEKLVKMGTTFAVIKGGHDQDTFEASDLLFDGESFTVYSSERLPTANTHGTGCTFSAAMTAQLAKGHSIHEAVSEAKKFIQAAIEDDLKIGSGHGPTNHWAYRRKRGMSLEN